MKTVKKLVVAIVVFFLMSSMLAIPNVSFASEPQSFPTIPDLEPGYWETSEYLIGTVAVGILFPESNGSIDVSTEDWTDFEIQQRLSKVHSALDFWSSENPDVRFVTEVHARVTTSYELISHNFTDMERSYAKSEMMTYLGYPINYSNPKPYSKYQMQDYLNDLRERLNTDWAFEIDIIDASNDSDGLYADGHPASASLGGPHLQVPVKTVDNLDWIVAHELAHIFWATDEYNGRREYRGYLNISDIDGSGGIMGHYLSWNISGKPLGLNGTWGQIGLQDQNQNGKPDIVEVPPTIYLNPTTKGRNVNITGLAMVGTYPNNNPYTRNPEGKRNVTVSAIQSVEVRIDNGTWQQASVIPNTIKKLVRYPDTFSYKQTYTVINFTRQFLTQEGNHTVEVRVTDDWNNTSITATTIAVQAFLPTDLNQDGRVNIQDITIIAVAYRSKPGDPKWNPIADLDKNGEVNIIDITMVARDYGKSL